MREAGSMRSDKRQWERSGLTHSRDHEEHQNASNCDEGDISEVVPGHYGSNDFIKTNL